MQKVDLDLDELKFYCPATGQRVFSMDEPYELSPATKFIYVYEAGEFEFITPELKAIYNEICEQAENCEDEELADSTPYELFSEKLRASGKCKQWVVFGISTYGMACGPVSSTVDVCVDMNHMEETQD